MSNDNRKPRRERESRFSGSPCSHEGCSHNKRGSCSHPAPVRSFDKCSEDDTPRPVYETDIHDMLAEFEEAEKLGGAF